MSKVNHQDFLLNTDYELDKIILVDTGNFTKKIEISHSLSFTPLVFGVWSTTSDFTGTNTLNVRDIGAEVGYTPKLGTTCIALSDKIIITATGDGSDTTPIYYRLYAFAPPTPKSNTATTSKLAKTFILNTDYNYRELKVIGEFTQPNQSYEHGLGYLPQVMAWVKYKDLPQFPDESNGVEPITDCSFFTNFGLIVTTTTIEITNFPFNLIDKIIWRIYCDEA